MIRPEQKIAASPRIGVAVEQQFEKPKCAFWLCSRNEIICEAASLNSRLGAGTQREQKAQSCLLTTFA